MRVRETLIVPLTPQARALARFFADAYSAEPGALERSLSSAGVGEVRSVFS